MVRGAAREKFGQRVSQRHGSDLLGRRDTGSDGPEPRSEARPDGCRGSNRQVLEQALRDQAELDVAVIGGDLASDSGTVAVRFTMKILANPTKFAHIRRVNALLGLFVPSLVTPLELLEAYDED
jgi:hypothetical protein